MTLSRCPQKWKTVTVFVSNFHDSDTSVTVEVSGFPVGYRGIFSIPRSNEICTWDSCRRSVYISVPHRRKYKVQPLFWVSGMFDFKIFRSL